MTIYLKIVDRKGASRIESRECWDKERFMTNVVSQYAGDKDNPCQVLPATREDYLASIKR